MDIIIANEDEVRQLTGHDPQKGCSLLKDICNTVIVTMGRQGCWIGHQGTMYQCPAYPVIPVDTTGAGDLFTSGFLHGFLNGRPIPECAHIGALAGRAVVQQQGTILPSDVWEQIERDAKQPFTVA